MNRIIKSLYLIIAIMQPTLFLPHPQKSNKPGMIILLNGTSSAGKTTLSQALQAIYENYEVAHIDVYTRRHNHGSWKTKCNGFYTEIKDVALSGQNIIVDTILYHDHYAAYDDLLTNRNQKSKPVKLIKILVYCSIDSIVDHVHTRNHLSNSLDHRTVHQALIGFLSLYTIKNATRATTIDMIDSVQTKIALQKAVSTIHPQAHRYLKRLAKINQKIIHQLNLNKVEKIRICPQHQWDLIVNTSNQTPEQVAQQIADFIRLLLKL